jgi:hypothetical protein
VLGIRQNEIVLDLDLTLLRNSKRFEDLCFRLARYEFPDAMSLSESWDGGRDIVVFTSRGAGDVVFQCKFTKNLLAAKAKIASSLDSLVKNGRRTARWILCVPVDPSGIFANWVRRELEKRHINGRLWARSELLARLEKHPDVVDTFFYPIYSELASHFRSDQLELFRLTLDPKCGWKQTDAKVLYLSPRGNVSSPDLVLDVIVRNVGTCSTALTGIEAEVFDWRKKMHGLPGEGLLFPQNTYSVSIRGGKIGVHTAGCEPPLVVKAGDLERFKIRVTNTGYAWNGGLRLSLLVGKTDRLCLPAIRIFT